jgi:hypothetical protein
LLADTRDVEVDAFNFASCSQRAIGVVNPVFDRSRTLAGSGTDGLAASIDLDEADREPVTLGILAIVRRSTLSTSGTRTSSACAMLAQSVSRSSWLRM